MTQGKRWFLAVGFLLVSGGYVVGFWGVSVVGILALAFGGLGIWAVAFALLLDLAYGAPLGLAQYLFFPFMLVALVASVVHFFGLRYFLHTSSDDHI